MNVENPCSPECAAARKQALIPREYSFIPSEISGTEKRYLIHRHCSIFSLNEDERFRDILLSLQMKLISLDILVAMQKMKRSIAIALQYANMVCNAP
jgi:hypothetical protein